MKFLSISGTRPESIKTVEKLLDFADVSTSCVPMSIRWHDTVCRRSRRIRRISSAGHGNEARDHTVSNGWPHAPLRRATCRLQTFI